MNETKNFFIFYAIALIIISIVLFILSLVFYSPIAIGISIVFLVTAIIELIFIVWYFKKEYVCDKDQCILQTKNKK